MNIVGVSTPRAGHHVLEHALVGLLQDDLGYCSDFAHGTCCPKLPCERRTGRFFLTKSHDYDLALAPDVPGVLYLVQDREPQGRIRSTAELIKKNRAESWPIESREFAAWWLAQQAVYCVRFRRKWIGSAPANAVIVEYDELVEGMPEVLRRVTRALGLDFARELLEEVAARSSASVAGTHLHFRPRKDAGDQLIPPELLADFDSCIRKRTPPFRAPMAPGAAASGDVEALYAHAASVEQMPRERALEVARTAALEGNRYFLMALSKRLDRLKAFEAAETLLEALAGRGFQLARVRMRQSLIAEQSGDQARALRLAEAALEAGGDPAPGVLDRINRLAGRQVQKPEITSATWVDHALLGLAALEDAPPEPAPMPNGPAWVTRGGLRQRDYPDDTAYRRHQASKFMTVRLGDYHPRFRETLIGRLRPLDELAPARTVLCLGARTGAECEAFMALGKLPVGVDLNPGPGNRWVVTGDFHDLQFPAGVFDAAFTNSLDHARDLARVLGEVRRVLAGGGILVAEIVKGSAEPGGREPGEYEALWWDHSSEVVDRIRAAGFDLLAQRDFTSPWGGTQTVWRRRADAAQTDRTTSAHATSELT